MPVLAERMAFSVSGEVVDMGTADLTWAAVIATYNRHDVLRVALGLCASQTLPPHEIVVVDGSPNAQEVSDDLRQIVSAIAPQIIFKHVPAEVLSLTCQRNQAIGLATADVLFLIDDDSLLYPDCAQQIMAIYQRDADQAIVGVEAMLAGSPPGEAADQLGLIAHKPKGRLSGLLGISRTFHRFMRRHVVLMDTQTAMIPYDGRYPKVTLPAVLDGLAISPIHLFQGCRMTFRRRVFEHEQFESVLRYYAAGEDLDFSLRASRHGLLVSAHEARLYHHAAAGGRLSRFTAIQIYMTNIAFFLAKNARNRSRAKRQLRLYFVRRMLAEWIKDSMSRRFNYPQLRAVWSAWPIAMRTMNKSGQDLDDHYAQVQAGIFESINLR